MTAAHHKINTIEASKEAEKIATFRVGSSGAITSENKAYYTQCGRLAQARYLGYQAPPTESMRAMFNGGLTLEDFVEQRLKVLGISFDKEKQIEVMLTPEIRVTGRPDFILHFEDGDVGIEVKSLASVFSVIKQRKNGQPFMKHMIQAATYMCAMSMPKWTVVIGHSFFVRDKATNIEPGLVWYEMAMEKDNEFTVTNEKVKLTDCPLHERTLYVIMSL